MKKTVSGLALVAATSVLASNAYAADLGGDCCADLEERIAELEVTTARKGNRVVSLTVYGSVNEAVIFWDDGTESNAYQVSHNAARSRFGFRGSATISSDLSAGYLMEFGVRRNASNAVQQQDARNAGNIDIRHEALYIDSKHWGRVWMGHTSTAMDGITEISLGGALLSGPDKSDDLGNFIGRVNGVFTTIGNATITWNTLASRSAEGWASGEGSRRNTVRYISPVLHGFTFSAAWADDDYWDASLRYANEFNGVRVAFGVGYGESTAEDTAGGDGGCGRANGVFAIQNGGVDCAFFGASGSLLHVASGLWVAGAYGYLDDDQNVVQQGNLIVVGPNARDDFWYISAGVTRKWHPLGATTLYGEYGEYQRDPFALAAGTNAAPVIVAFNGSDVQTYGFGFQQDIDSAAMNLYVDYKHYEGSLAGIDVDALDLVTVGARIQF